jgi:hypothetical protein
MYGWAPNQRPVVGLDVMQGLIADRGITLPELDANVREQAGGRCAHYDLLWNDPQGLGYPPRQADRCVSTSRPYRPGSASSFASVGTEYVVGYAGHEADAAGQFRYGDQPSRQPEGEVHVIY